MEYLVCYEKKHLEAKEMWFLRKMLRILWTDKVTNERVTLMASVIKNRKMAFLGYIMHRNEIENLSLLQETIFPLNLKILSFFSKCKWLNLKFLVFLIHPKYR